MEEKIYMKAFIRASDKQNIYQNTPYNAFDYIGDIGGVITSLMTVCMFLISGLVRHFYETSLIENTY